jgi:hypothetical protein
MPSAQHDYRKSVRQEQIFFAVRRGNPADAGFLHAVRAAAIADWRGLVAA